MNVRILLLTITGGVIVTLLTGLISNTQLLLVGAIHYGYPFAWLTRLVIAPEYFPWRLNVMNLVADVVVWTVIIGIVLSAVTRAKKS